MRGWLARNSSSRVWMSLTGAPRLVREDRADHRRSCRRPTCRRSRRRPRSGSRAPGIPARRARSHNGRARETASACCTTSSRGRRSSCATQPMVSSEVCHWRADSQVPSTTTSLRLESGIDVAALEGELDARRCPAASSCTSGAPGRERLRRATTPRAALRTGRRCDRRRRAPFPGRWPRPPRLRRRHNAPCRSPADTDRDGTQPHLRFAVSAPVTTALTPGMAAAALDVDGDDAGMRMRTAQHGGMQHARASAGRRRIAPRR